LVLEGEENKTRRRKRSMIGTKQKERQTSKSLGEARGGGVKLLFIEGGEVLEGVPPKKSSWN